MREALEYLSRFLKELGTLNLLVIGIAIIVTWLLISGFKKGLKKGDRDKGPEENDHGQ